MYSYLPQQLPPHHQPARPPPQPPQPLSMPAMPSPHLNMNALTPHGGQAPVPTDIPSDSVPRHYPFPPPHHQHPQSGPLHPLPAPPPPMPQGYYPGPPHILGPSAYPQQQHPSCTYCPSDYAAYPSIYRRCGAAQPASVSLTAYVALPAYAIPPVPLEKLPDAVGLPMAQRNHAAYPTSAHAQPSPIYKANHTSHAPPPHQPPAESSAQAHHVPPPHHGGQRPPSHHSYHQIHHHQYDGNMQQQSLSVAKLTMSPTASKPSNDNASDNTQHRSKRPRITPQSSAHDDGDANVSESSNKRVASPTPTSTSTTSATVTVTASASPSVRLHKCPHCPKSFSRPSSLATHTYTHTGEKPFACDCGAMFSVLSNLRRHRRKRLGSASATGPCTGSASSVSVAAKKLGGTTPPSDGEDSAYGGSVSSGSTDPPRQRSNAAAAAGPVVGSRSAPATVVDVVTTPPDSSTDSTPSKGTESTRSP